MKSKRKLFSIVAILVIFITFSFLSACSGVSDVIEEVQVKTPEESEDKIIAEEAGEKEIVEAGEKEDAAGEEKVVIETGQDITISGMVTYDGYTQGEIFIGAYEEKYLMPLGTTVGVEPLQEAIGAVPIQAPGAYSLQVPANSGEVWIAAINDENNNNVLEVDWEPAGKYADNPLIIGTECIDGVNIILNPGGLF